MLTVTIKGENFAELSAELKRLLTLLEGAADFGTRYKVTRERMEVVLARYAAYHDTDLAVEELIYRHSGERRLEDAPMHTWPAILQEASTFVGGWQ